MALSEIDSFVCKFKYLWHAGFDATRKVDTNAGKAWLSFQAGLERDHWLPFQLPQHGRHVQRHSGPAQQRRRESREAARRTAGTEENNDIVGDTAEEVAADFDKLVDVAHQMLLNF